MSDLVDDVAGSVAAEEPSLPLPGGVLRAAREAYGYSLLEVSQVLKFSVRQLEALENDDYSTLQGSTFIRGFVRSYARYLRLDELPLLAALEPKATVAPVEVRAVENMGAEMPVGSADGSKRVYWLAAVVLLLGAGAWFALQDAPSSSTASEIAAPISVPLPEQAEAEQATPAVTPSKVPAEAASGETVSRNMTEVPLSAASSVGAETGVAAAAPSVVNPNERRVVLSFSDVSWVEIRDASERVLYSGQSTPGSRQMVHGRPPFQLVIGNAQAVKLRYEDRDIDLQPYTRVDVARLTLDDNTK